MLPRPLVLPPLALLLFSASPALPGVSTPGGPDRTGIVLRTSGAAAFDGEWTPIVPSGARPSARRDHAFVLDSRRDQVIVTGGTSGVGTYALSLDVPTYWSLLVPLTPASFSAPCGAIVDAAHDRVVLLTSGLDVWQLDLADPVAWSPLLTSGPAPAPRPYFAVAHDRLRNRLILYGGGPTPGLYGDVWALALDDTPHWTQITTPGQPVPRWGPAAVYDAARDRLVVVGGSLDANYAVTSEVWALSLGSSPSWEPLQVTGTLPDARLLAGAVYDEANDCVMLYGGYPGVASEDVWELALGGEPAWTKLAPAGTAPHGRWSCGAVYRSTSPAFVVFGGYSFDGYLNDVWSLSRDNPAGKPFVSKLEPEGGRVGDPVVLRGARLLNAVSVEFNGTSAPILSATYSTLETRVPAGAVTGPVAVTNPYGTSFGPVDFFVGETPVIEAAVPPQAKVGDLVELRGRHFTGAVEVRFGGAGDAPFTLHSDSLIEARVDEGARPGPIEVTTLAATGVSAFDFVIQPYDTAARIVDVRDVPLDQGGFVTVRWLRSDLDVAPNRSIAGYRLWRAAPGAGAAAGPGRADPLFHRPNPAAVESGFWVPVAEVPAAYLDGYAYIAPTTSDSSEAGNPYVAFFVQTLTDDPYVFFNSTPDGGYSVDNLAPPAPAPFTATYGPSGVALHWAPSPAPDVRAYRLHRGASADFMPGADNLVTAQADTGYFDDAGDAAHYYKLAAVDVHGNVGRYAIVSPALPTAALSTLVWWSADDGRVRLRWYLSTDEPMTVTVYRRAPRSSWRPLDTATPDGLGFVDYVDAAVVGGGRYAYRLGLRSAAGSETFSVESWLDVPLLAADGAVTIPNPVIGGEVLVSLAAAAGDEIRVDLFDAAGRLIASRTIAGGIGRQTVALARASELVPGIYLVRVGLTAPKVARVAVLR